MIRFWFFILLLSWMVSKKVHAQKVKSLIESQPEKLLTALKQYREIAESETWSTFPSDICLLPGQTDQNILKLRNNLSLTGDLQVFNADATVFFYDTNLFIAVKRFQKRHALAEDGIVGQQTLAALNVAPEQRIKQIELNLTRWLEVPEVEYPVVFINIPDFTLSLFNVEGEEIWKTNVIVGQAGKAYQTVPLRGNISYLVFHPTWNVPKSIIQKEIIPGFKTDPNFLSRNHMQLYRQDGTKKVPLSDDVLKQPNLNLRNLSLIQSAGPWNALGQVKFIFPNSYDIYLHDTPAKSLFSHPVRAYSHGCIRVQNPEILASYLLTSDWTNPVPVNSIFKKNKAEKITQLPKSVPVQIGYYTCWIDKEGLLQFRKDIYKLDELQDPYNAKTSNYNFSSL